MEPHEKLEQSIIAKTKGTKFFKVSYIMNKNIYLIIHNLIKIISQIHSHMIATCIAYRRGTDL